MGAASAHGAFSTVTAIHRRLVSGPDASAGRILVAMRLYGLVDDMIGEVLEFFPDEESATPILLDCLPTRRSGRAC